VGRLIVVGGGVRSGKSSFALARARAIGSRRAFVATAQPTDDEMRARIARHVRERQGAFVTLEAPFDLPAAVSALRDLDVAVIDCLTFWLSNLLLRGDPEERIASEVESLLGAMADASFHTIVVTNEVGMGVVPEHALGRAFRDVAGRAHQRIASGAHELYFAAMGCIIRLRPGPVELEPPVSPH
jgi:adenosylcobinamide kinase/adenosylcobinamide-phosphate guanylyltransferase